MSPQQDRKIVQQDLGRLHPAEIELIFLIRTRYRFGNIEIITKDGLPIDILRTVERQRLGVGTYPHDTIARETLM